MIGNTQDTKNIQVRWTILYKYILFLFPTRQTLNLFFSIGTENDIITFSLLLDDIRAELDKLEDETGKYYKLTAALPCGPQVSIGDANHSEVLIHFDNQTSYLFLAIMNYTK